MDREYTLSYIVNAGPAVEQLSTVRKTLWSIGESALESGAKLRVFAASLNKLEQDSKNTLASLEKTNAALSDISFHVKEATTDAAALGTGIGPVTKNITIMGEETAKSTASINSMAGGCISLYAGMQVFQLGSQLAQAFNDQLKAARDKLDELADKATETRDKMRELANLKGEDSPNNKVVGEAVSMGLEAGLTPEEATKFLEQFEGSSPAGRDKGNIDPKVEKQLAIEGMRFGARVKIQEATAGDLTGVLSQYGKIRSVEEGAGQLGAIAHGLNEGRGNLEPLAKTLLKTAGAIVDEDHGSIKSLPELAAFIGVASTASGTAASGTLARSAVGALRHFNIDPRTKRAKDKQTQALMDMNITPDMTTQQAMNAMAPALATADASGQGADIWLEQHGFNEKKERDALVLFSRNITGLNRRIDESKTSADGKAVIEQDHAFQTRSRVGISRQTKAEKASQDLLKGIAEEDEKLAREAGRTALHDQRKGEAHRNPLRNFLAKAETKITFQRPEEDTEAMNAFLDNLEAEGKKVGVDVGDMVQAAMHPGMTAEKRREIYGKTGRLSQESFAISPSILSKTIRAVEGAGGHPFDIKTRTQAQLQRLATTPENPGSPAAAPAAANKGVQDMVEEQRKTNEHLRQLKQGPGRGADAVAPGRKY